MVFIKLQLCGKNMDMDLITHQIGTAPTFTCKEGDINTHAGGKIEVKAVNDSWIYDIEADAFSEELLKNFLNKFSSCVDVFASLREKNIIPYLVVSLYMDDDYQKILSLSHSTVSLISKLKLELCIDVMTL